MAKRRFSKQEVVDQTAKIKALRAKGVTLVDIASSMGLCVATVHARARSKAKEDTPEEAERKAEVKEMLVHELELSVVRCSHWEAKAGTSRELTEAIQGKARASSELAKLLGLYAPKIPSEGLGQDDGREDADGKVVPINNSRLKTTVRM